MQRAADIAAAAPIEWKREHGDLTIPWDQAQGHLAIVVDDTGRELHLFEQLLSLRFPLTFSVLPGSIFAAGVQLRAQHDRRRYRDILLHLPMEPDDASLMHREPEAGESFLLVRDSPEELTRKTLAALSAVPAAVGVNNHMGSRLTANRAAMNVVMAALNGRDLFYLDSRTTAQTVAVQAAQAIGLPAASRQVFLDHDPSAPAIEEALVAAAHRARTEPTIAIAHPSPELVSVLQQHLPRLHAEGVAVYPLSRLLAASPRSKP